MKHTINILFMFYLYFITIISKTSMQQTRTKSILPSNRAMIAYNSINPAPASSIVQKIERKINTKHPVTEYIEKLNPANIPSHITLKDFENNKREVYFIYTKELCENNNINCPLFKFIYNLRSLNLKVDQYTLLNTQIINTNQANSTLAEIKIIFTFSTQLSQSEKN